MVQAQGEVNRAFGLGKYLLQKSYVQIVLYCFFAVFYLEF